MIKKILVSVVPFVAAMSLMSCTTMNNPNESPCMKDGTCMTEAHPDCDCDRSCGCWKKHHRRMHKKM